MSHRYTPCPFTKIGAPFFWCICSGRNPCTRWSRSCWCNALALRVSSAAPVAFACDRICTTFPDDFALCCIRLLLAEEIPERDHTQTTRENLAVFLGFMPWLQPLVPLVQAALESLLPSLKGL